ncbi:MAG: TIGR02302 family protein [Rhodospirillaceae bacterium]|nr:TIGR02302 family protein [Rhodospirillaceae bacterium]MBT4589975.1 TIGR02302 family protein [Rhodospirillaceae bacterium]MBT4938735.1 TIGR02302 family protein [Rhodospirillaceae bacterium]MBT5938579.1 TIGR02302 family protein [Rhodospirillaceae bacterium]MBT7265311.1 TIGR02302 family protein [Rhodospirillaceae bacterium]
MRNKPKKDEFLYKIYLRLAKASLTWERLWPALWPAVALAGVFSIAALLELFSHLPIWLHAGIVVAFLIGFLAALQKAVTRLPRIKVIQAQHHIEQASQLNHRPLAALDDTLAAGGGDATARALWRAHQARMAQETDHLKLGIPQAGLAKRDPWGMRAGIALMLVVGVIAAGSDSFNRLGRALLPELSALTLGRSVSINIWITPPAYTNVPPIILNAGTQIPETSASKQPKLLKIPAGSTFLAQVNGGGAVPQLTLGKAAKATDMLNFDRIEADAYHLEAELGGEGENATNLDIGDRLSIMQHGHELAGWPLSLKKDTGPVVEFSGAPEATPQLRLQLPFSAKDDYGVKTVRASIRRLDGKKIPGGEDEIILRLPLPGQEKTNVKGKSNHDLVSHVWAGLPVLVHLLASDELGQTGLSQVEPVVLPERRFSHPAAKELYEIRKRLAVDQRSRILAGLKLDQLSEEPKLFQGNKAVYLGLRVARERLKRDKRERAVVQVQKMLWDMALRIEEGLAATAGADLRAAQRRLMEALDRNADAKEIERLMNEVQKALEKFMSSLMRELQQRGQLQQMDPNAQTMTNQDIQRMLDRARELMRQGNRDAAKQLMAELQRMLENLRSALSRGGRQSQQSKQAQKTMKELRDIIRRQQKLLDETHKRAQRDPAEREQEGKKDTEGLKDQEGIRRQLGKMMQKFGEMMGKIPKGLGTAERAMREAEKSLGRGRQGESVGPQGRALDALRKGAQNSARALAQRMGRGRGRANGQRGPGGRFGAFSGPRLRGMRPGNRDPFGRRQQEEGNQGTATGRVKIPGEREMQRAREILNELRRRAGDLWRPEMELDYIERLLKRF